MTRDAMRIQQEAIPKMLLSWCAATALAARNSISETQPPFWTKVTGQAEGSRRSLVEVYLQMTSMRHWTGSA